MENQSHSIPLTLFYFLPILFISLKILNKLLRSNDSNLRLPPGPWKLPLIGNMHQFVGGTPHRLLANLGRKHGSLMHLKLGELSFFVISTPEGAKEAMKFHDINFASRPVTLPMELILYKSFNLFLAPYGDYWKRVRKMCVNELLSLEKVKSFRSIRENEVSAFARAISSSAGSPSNLSQMLFSTTYQIICNAAIGSRGTNAEKFAQIIEKISKETSNFTLVDLFPSYKLLHIITGVRNKLRRIHQEADDLFGEIVHQRKAEKAKRNDEINDLLDVLLDIQDKADPESPLTTTNIKAILMDIILPGIETSATTAEWAMSEMLKNPKVMEKAQAEVRQVFETKGAVNEADLHQLTYLKLVIKETLRIHSPLPLLLRQNMERCEISGYEIPAKSRVLVNVWALGRDPGFWKEPETFLPERFLNSSIDFKGANFEFIPFGAGRRICPGIIFSSASMELMLATLLYHFDWKLPDGKKPEELDMTEAIGSTVRRKHDLLAVPVLRSH